MSLLRTAHLAVYVNLSTDEETRTPAVNLRLVSLSSCNVPVCKMELMKSNSGDFEDETL